jgi:hypothetical protein
MQLMLQVGNGAMHRLHRLLYLVVDIAALLACLHCAVAQFFETVNAVENALRILLLADHRCSLSGFPFKLADAVAQFIRNIAAGLA